MSIVGSSLGYLYMNASMQAAEIRQRQAIEKHQREYIEEKQGELHMAGSIEGEFEVVESEFNGTSTELTVKRIEND